VRKWFCFLANNYIFVCFGINGRNYGKANNGFPLFFAGPAQSPSGEAEPMIMMMMMMMMMSE